MALQAHQEDMVVLTVDVDQAGDQIAQALERDEHAVTVGLGRALVRHEPLHGHLSVLSQGRRSARRPGQDGFDYGFAATGPDEVGRGLFAADQTQAVDEDGLTGAGFPGQDGEPRREAQLQVLDGGEVPDAQMADHAVAIVFPG
jgi:hypothetical protein